MQKKSKPKFNVQNLGRTQRKRIKDRWRRPRGQSNKKKSKLRQTGGTPGAGYKNHPTVRGMHPCGKKEILIHNLASLEGIKGLAVRIGSGVSKRKKDGIRAKAKELKIEVLN